MSENSFKYRELLTKLSTDRSWIKTYLTELKLQQGQVVLRKQIAELQGQQGETKQILIDRFKQRIEELDKMLGVRASSVIHKLLDGQTTAGRRPSEGIEELMTELFFIKGYKLPYIEGLDTREQDATYKHCQGEIRARTQEIQKLQGKVDALVDSNGRFPFSISTGLPDKSIDGFALYTENLIENFSDLNDEQKSSISAEDKQLLLAKGIKF